MLARPAGHSAMSELLTGFPPVAQADARVLILGSMPGQRSLAEQQYYAQPRNAFWYIMGELFGAGPALPYPARLFRLQQSGIALWDVLARCRRRGSLDQHIEPGSIKVNDFNAFLARHPALGHICFNGRTAARLFSRQVLPGLEGAERLRLHTLPSSSPAMASLRPAQKLAHWTVIRNQLLSS